MVIAAPPAIVAIAQRTASEERGVVLYHLRRIFDVHAGPFHRHDELEMAVVSVDGQTARVHVSRASVGGKDLDAAGRTSIEQQYEHPKPDDLLHRPFDPRYLSEYTYTPTDAQTFAFSSAIHDASHGNGTFNVDSGLNVVRYSYAPNVLPKYSSSGTVTYQRAQVLPGFWFLTSEVHEYRGHYGIFGGGAQATISYDKFKRFTDEGSAVSAMNQGDL